ncbi:hypothetical protein CsSME_00009496 [Camellia sinensis var. sinensis]
MIESMNGFECRSYIQPLCVLSNCFWRCCCGVWFMALPSCVEYILHSKNKETRSMDEVLIDSNSPSTNRIVDSCQSSRKRDYG